MAIKEKEHETCGQLGLKQGHAILIPFEIPLASASSAPPRAAVLVLLFPNLRRRNGLWHSGRAMRQVWNETVTDSPE